MKHATSAPHVRRRVVRFASSSVTDAGVISGYGSIFGVVDTYGSVMMPGCFATSLATYAAAGKAPPMCWQHELETPIGAWTSLSEDSTGLLCTGQLVLEVEKAREALALLKASVIDGLSIGFEYVDREDVSPEEAAARGLNLDAAFVNPETGCFEFVHEVDLWEISVVTKPSCPEAEIDEVRAPQRAPATLDWSQIASALSQRGEALRRF